MDQSLELSDLDPAVLEEPAKHLEPNDIKRLGELLSSDCHIFGPCWDAVAGELGFSMEERRAIHDKAARRKMAEGRLVLQGWAETGDTECRTLFVLQSALQKCQRPDIMTLFVDAVRNMNRVTMHVIVKFPPDLPDNQNRLQRLIQDTNSRTTLEQLLANKLQGEITDYEVSAPKWAEWQTTAGALKGNQVTITRLSPHITRYKPLWKPRQEEIMDTEVTSTSNIKDTPLLPNIPYCVKMQNNCDIPSISDNEEEEDYMPMNFCQGVDTATPSVVSDSGSDRLSSIASFCTTSSELQFPQDTYWGTALVRPVNSESQSSLGRPLPSPPPLPSVPSPVISPADRKPVAPPPCLGMSVSAPVALPTGPRPYSRFQVEELYDDFQEGRPLNGRLNFSDSKSPSDHGSPMNAPRGLLVLSSPDHGRPWNPPEGFSVPRSPTSPVTTSFCDSFDSQREYLTPRSSRCPSQNRVTEELGAVGGEPEQPEVSPVSPLGRKLRPVKFIPQAVKELEAAMIAGWHGPIKIEQLRALMSSHKEENGCFVVWWSREQDELIVSITHCGAVLHYNIRARAADKDVFYYLFKYHYRDTSVVNLLAHYKTHPLENKLNAEGAYIPVKLRRAL